MRGWTHPLLVLAAAAVGVISDQRAFQKLPASGSGPAQRAFNRANSTGNLIFWSVNSLLQHWPNTRYVNGMVTFP